MQDQPRTCRQRGFTLVELLVTVGIIVILIALLLPVLAKARAQANTVRCMGNQRQLMQACISYASDNDGYLPPPNWDGAAQNKGFPAGWLYNPKTLSASNTFLQTDAESGVLYPYLSNGGQPLSAGQAPSPNALQVYRCYIDDGNYPPNTVQAVTSYVMNGAVCDFNNDQPEKLGRFKATAILLWEIPSAGVYQTETGQTDNGEVNDGANYPAEEITTRHQNGSTVGFVDGHAEQMTWTQFTSDWYYPTTGPGMLWCAPAIADGGYSECKSALPGYFPAAGPPGQPPNGD